MNRWPGIPDNIPMQWKAEHRMLAKQKQDIERRMAELEEMMTALGPEVK